MGLKRGSTGAGVETLQLQLRGLGYAVTTDGVFGTQTDVAVRHFQGSRGIAVDGDVGPTTINALFAATQEGWRTNNPAPWSAGVPGQAGGVTMPAAGQPVSMNPSPTTQKAGWALLLVIAAGVWYAWKQGWINLGGGGKGEEE